MKTYDVVIVGGGIIGCAIALALSRRKLRVALLDRQEMLQEASWAAAGMLSPAPDCTAAIPLVPLARASLALYGEFVADLEDVSGLAAGYRHAGTLEALFLGDPERELSTLVALHHGLGLACEPLPIEEALHLEPTLGDGMRAAALLPDESSVDVRALGAALLAAVKISGAELFPATAAATWIADGNRCRGIKTTSSDIFSSAEVVLAAGCWTNQVGEAEKFAPVRPVRGQMVSLLHRGRTIHRVLRSELAYIVPRGEASPQTLVVGSTLEHAGYEKCVTSAGLEKILSAVNQIVPELGKAEILDTWSGLRPGTPDQLPIVGPTHMTGMSVATGHYRNGILLAPITARAIENWIIDRRSAPEWEIFSPLRFQGSQDFTGPRGRATDHSV